MPVLGGIEATRLLKASKATRRSAVIAYTATPISAEGPLGQLFVGVLRKPANPDAVIAMVEQFAAWQELGASHISLNTMKAGLAGPAHIEALRRFREATAARW